MWSRSAVASFGCVIHFRVMRLIAMLFLLAAACKAGELDVTPIPASTRERLGLAPFYEKICELDGFAIVSSGKVSTFALLEAAEIVRQMVAHRPALLRAIADARVRLAIMAPGEFTTDIPEHRDLRPREYWDQRARGLGANQQTRTVSCGEENLLGYAGDPYSTENILIHEFGHVLHEIALAAIDPEFDRRLQKAWDAAIAAGLWKGKYPSVNRMEYWAEGVQSWFDTNRENDPDHNAVNTRAELKDYDPELAALLAEILGDGTWRYVRPAERRPPSPHLAGYDPSRAPRFTWPERLLEWRRKLRLGEVSLAPADAELLAPLALREEWRSPRAAAARVALHVLNASTHALHIDWIDFDGLPRTYATLRPGEHFQNHTFRGHVWRVRDAVTGALTHYAPGPRPGSIVIKNSGE